MDGWMLARSTPRPWPAGAFSFFSSDDPPLSTAAVALRAFAGCSSMERRGEEEAGGVSCRSSSARRSASASSSSGMSTAREPEEGEDSGGGAEGSEDEGGGGASLTGCDGETRAVESLMAFLALEDLPLFSLGMAAATGLREGFGGCGSIDAAGGCTTRGRCSRTETDLCVGNHCNDHQRLLCRTPNSCDCATLERYRKMVACGGDGMSRDWVHMASHVSVCHCGTVTGSGRQSCVDGIVARAEPLRAQPRC